MLDRCFLKFTYRMSTSSKEKADLGQRRSFTIWLPYFLYLLFLSVGGTFQYVDWEYATQINEKYQIYCRFDYQQLELIHLFYKKRPNFQFLLQILELHSHSQSVGLLPKANYDLYSWCKLIINKSCAIKKYIKSTQFTKQLQNSYL